jgi:hypothetical protein
MHSAEELAKKLQFNSAEEMHNQLEDWDVPDWLIGVETNSGKGKARGKGTPPAYGAWARVKTSRPLVMLRT